MMIKKTIIGQIYNKSLNGDLLYRFFLKVNTALILWLCISEIERF